MSDIVAQVSKTIDASPKEIWHALTTPKLLKQYFLGADIESDWKVGSAIHFRGEHQGKRYEDKGEILTFDPERQLRMSHWSPLSGAADMPENYHVVTFDLAPRGNQTHVTLSQSNLKGGVTPGDVASRAEFEKNWQTVLDGLAKVLEHEDATVT